jgi:hypothetical protein
MRVSSSHTPSARSFVVHVSADARASDVRRRAGAVGSLEGIEGHADLLLLSLRERYEDARVAWQSVREALGGEIEIAPVLLDPAGEPRYPTGRIAVRFREAPSDSELAQFAAQHGLRVRLRNRYVEVQVEFQLESPEKIYLPDLLEQIEGSRDVRAVWPETLARYRRD